MAPKPAPPAAAEAPTPGPDGWDFTLPHVIEFEVDGSEIDAYGHVNNAVYLQWFDRVAWSHAAHLGVSLEACIAARRGMAALRSEVDYLAAALLGDRVRIASWIVATDGRLRVTRRFQVRRARDDATLTRARIDYVCLNLDSGRAARMPPLFRERYVALRSSRG